MSRALWFGQPVEVIDYDTDPDVGEVARVRTGSGAVKYAPTSTLEDAPACPSWCTNHPPNEPMIVHTGTVWTQNVAVWVSEWPDGSQRLYVNDRDVEEGMTPAGAVVLSLALARAAETMTQRGVRS